MDFISLGYYNDFNVLKWILFSLDIIMIYQALMTSTCQVRSDESIDRFIELLGLWKLNYLASDFGEKKETKMKMKLNEWRQLAGCYFFSPTFSVHVLLNILNLFVTNQQIINIVLEYKYFVSCWQHNKFMFIVWLILHSKSHPLCYCLAASSTAIVWRMILWYHWDCGGQKNTDKARFQ